jgi:Icc protein
MSTAFPQPTPGTAPAPGPMKVDAARLGSVLGVTNVTFIAGRSALAVVDATLSGEPPAFESASHDAMMKRQSERKAVVLGPNEVGIDNFQFSPPNLTAAKGTTVTWTNNDDVPHLVLSTKNKFRSEVLDTGKKFSTTFNSTGTFDYFCALHPKMTGKITIT